MGIDRIKHNLKIDVKDVIKYCNDLIVKADARMERQGKNWYVYVEHIKLRVNAHSYAIITAHREK